MLRTRFNVLTEELVKQVKKGDLREVKHISRELRLLAIRDELLRIQRKIKSGKVTAQQTQSKMQELLQEMTQLS